MARLKNLWQFGLSGARSVTQRCPLIVGEQVLAIFNHEQRGFRGCLVALDRDTGEPRWQFQQPHFLNQAVVTASGDILLTCFDGSRFYLHGIDSASGACHWRTPYPTTLFKPLLVDDLIYIGSHGHIALFSAISGELLATFRLADEADSVQLTPLLTDAGVVCVSNNGEVLCVRAKTVKSPFHAGREWLLERQWQQRLAVAVKAAPQLNASGDILLIAEDGRMLSLTTNDDLLISEHKLPQFKTGYGLACDGDKLVVAASRNCMMLAR